jgi:hypothetical protein
MVGATCSGTLGDFASCDADYGYAEGLFCDASQCAQTLIGVAGQMCDYLSSATACALDAACLADGICRAPASDGAPCGGVETCQPPAQCVAGMCQMPDASSCK